MVEGSPPGIPFRHPHSEQRRPARAHAVGPLPGPHARTDRTRDTRVAEPWLPAPEEGRPGEGQRLTPDAPHNGGRPPPPVTAPHHPRGTQPPPGMQAKGTVLGPHTHTPAPTARGWRTPTARPVGGQSGEGQRLNSDAPHSGGRHPPGIPLRHLHSELRRPARAHAVEPVLGPQARTDRTRDTRVAEPWLPAPEDGRPGEGQCVTPDARHNGGRIPFPGTPPPHPRGTQPPQGMQAKGTVLGPHTHTHAPTARGWRTPTARPVVGQSGEGQCLTSDAPHNGGRQPPGDALPPPPQRATPARKGARCGARAGSPRPHRPHPGHTGRGTLAARSRGWAVGGGTAPDTRLPSKWWKAPPPGTPFRHAHSDQRRPAGAHAVGPVLGHHARTDRTRGTRVAQPRLPAPEDSVGPPHPHTRADSTWVADPNSPPSGRAVRGGTAPDLRRPSQWWKTPPPGAPLRHLHSEQRWPARAPAVGSVLGPQARTDRTRDTRVVEPRLPAPEDGRPGEGQRLTPDAPHNGGRPPPPGTAPQHPRGTQPPQGMQAKGTVLCPHTHTPAPTARGWRTPTAHPVGGQSGEGQRLISDAPHNGGRHPPRGRPSATPTASNAGPQGRTLWGRCWIPTPAPTAPGTHGSRNPGCSLQRTGGGGRDRA